MATAIIIDKFGKAQEIDPQAIVHPRGINWTWISFSTRELANEYVKFLDNNDLDNRGVYGNADGTADVRVRPW